MAARALIAVALISAVAACAAPERRVPHLAPGRLLSPEALEAGTHAPLVPPHEITAVDDAMRAFVAQHVDADAAAGRRLRQLLTAMRDEGLLDLTYTAAETRTARETFRLHRGNCLSFTILFVALAREAGLDVSYQMVDIPPVWASGSGVVLLNNHINALISGTYTPEYVVDFNAMEYRGNYEARTVEDSYAAALFYNNLGVEAMSAGRTDESFAYFRQAASVYPDVVAAWVNLGVLYSRNGLGRHAEAAYLEALQREPRNPSALVNLANLYRSLGDSRLAESYEDRVRRYQRSNPYYHYSLANQAYRNDQPERALRLLDDALRLKKDEHLFHFLRALAYLELGDAAAARASLDLARSYAAADDIERRYAAKLAALAGYGLKQSAGGADDG